MATRFSGGGHQSTWREPPTMGKQPANGEVYSIQNYVIKFVSDL
jgi:hypothetical protein